MPLQSTPISRRIDEKEYDLIIEFAPPFASLPIPAEILGCVDQPTFIIECYLNIVKSQTNNSQALFAQYTRPSYEPRRRRYEHAIAIRKEV